jgi:hypothetical protein
MEGKGWEFKLYMLLKEELQNESDVFMDALTKRLVKEFRNCKDLVSVGPPPSCFNFIVHFAEMNNEPIVYYLRLIISFATLVGLALYFLPQSCWRSF